MSDGKESDVVEVPRSQLESWLQEIRKLMNELKVVRRSPSQS